MTSHQSKVAFVSGCNGISGHAIVDHLVRQPESEWSKIIVSSRTPLVHFWSDPRIQFVGVDFMWPHERIVERLAPVCSLVTHVYYTAYAHSKDFKSLPKINVPLFQKFMDAIDAVFPKLQRVLAYTGGKYYGAHLGKLKAPAEESSPRYIDDGDNFYYNQEDYLVEVQQRRKQWQYNVIRPTGIIGFTPHANGMSEALSIAVYFLLCRELSSPAHFPGNEFLWEGVDDKSYAPSIADLAVFASTHDHCANQIFNHANGDVIVWKNFWPKIAQYYGLKAPIPKFDKARGHSSNLIVEFDVQEWARDKKPAWEQVVQKYGGRMDVFDWVSWDHWNWALGRSWSTLLSVNKAREYGWIRFDDTYKTWLDTWTVLENAGILPKPQPLGKK
ncbi:hypothetical protein N7530_000012 [Penicillium desertorum]|uniref:PRISE-like Rossmann-fold domain-containing protein n=1 Tax=Penicillium desertorum TaxID=1303715 RepID=A0A9W9X7F6_9EURO|nr:hypothetical protein N7530_000012 [Penicillium desertorum]